MHVSIVGCGQLARMLAMAGMRLGHSFSFLAEEGEETRCVDGLGKIVYQTREKAFDLLYVELGCPDVVTIEKEQLDVELLQELSSFCTVYPNVEAVSYCQNRRAEKELLECLDIPAASYLYGEAIKDPTFRPSFPLVAKSCREGYDGKNQQVIHCQEELRSFISGTDYSDYIFEQWIPFDKEISQVSVRSGNGEIRHYPLADNVHEKGILKRSLAPALETPENVVADAREFMSRILGSLDYVGVMAMECFLLGEQLLVNELAPRVHNSGHWTQAGSRTCQFENHIRAITGDQIGSTVNYRAVGMVNIIGQEITDRDMSDLEGTLHWYNKTVRPGRKLGHINFASESHEDVMIQLNKFLQTGSLR